MSVHKFVEEHNIKWVDLRFCDIRGKEHHVTIRASDLDAEKDYSVRFFDGSSVAGWRSINDSDMGLKVLHENPILDRFQQEPTMILRCLITHPDGEEYNRDPRTIGKRAESYLKQTGIADVCYFGPEPEFFVFDDVRYQNHMSGSSFSIDSIEAAWASNKDYGPELTNQGHRPSVKGGYFPVPPVDSLMQLRTEICEIMPEFGVTPELHHHEVATAGQCEIGMTYDELVKKGDNLMNFKYIVANVAHEWGKTATFMAKPLVGDNGSGMHIHCSLAKAGENLFQGENGELSEMCRLFIGGLLKHARVINAFANSTTNSYRRLVPGFEAPTALYYSKRNRSVSVRIPAVATPKATRLEMRFPDSMGSPYLTFASMLMAGLDGIQKGIDPGPMTDRDMFAAEDAGEDFPRLCASLPEALNALDNDRDFLKAGDVFCDDMIDGYIALKREEVKAVRSEVTPGEFERYYSC